MADNTGYAPLGKVGMRPRGEWVIGTLYEKLDIVSYNGSSYLALIDNSVKPSDDGVNWMLIARGASSDSLTNAETLGGQSPEYYATAQSVVELTKGIDAKITTINSSISGKAPTSHSHSASNVTAGTLAEKVLANATAVATLGNKQVRNIYAGTSDMVAGSTALPTGDIYIMYE